MKLPILLGAIATLLAPSVKGASLQQVTNFGTNPTNAQMFIYVPDRLATNPPILVAAHYCGGTAQAYYSGTRYASLADQYGYIVIYPDAPRPENCWDVFTDATLKHEAGGDSLSIVSMVRYALQRYNGDANRVFVTGTSSGGMMTNVLIGAYPDVFAGGAAFCGTPFGCFAGGVMFNDNCAGGRLIKTAQQWGDQVRNAYPGYTGRRPKMQLWHGTSDEVVNYQNHLEGIKQWTNVFGYSSTPTSQQSNSPVNGWTRSIYGPNFQAISAPGVGHGIPVQENDVLAFFGLNGSATTTPGNTTPNPTPTLTPTPTPTPTPTTTQGGGTVPRWGQCGGIGWTGGTTCVSPYTCTKLNDWYYQCL